MADNRMTLHVEREDGERFRAGAKEAGVTTREWFGIVLDDLERLSKLEASQTTAAMKRLEDAVASLKSDLFQEQASHAKDMAPFIEFANVHGFFRRDKTEIEWCAEYLEQTPERLNGWVAESENLRSQLSASKEARRLAEGQAASWKKAAEENAKALDEAREACKMAEQNTADIHSDMENIRAELMAAMEIIGRDGARLINEKRKSGRLEDELSAYRSMGFRDHIRAAFSALGRA